jgi:hypothetical protein
MTDKQAAAILLMLRAAYPGADAFLDERTAAAREKLYARKLLKLNYATATEAVERVIDVSKRYPDFATFREHYDASAQPRPELERSGQRAIPAKGDTIASPEQARAAREHIERVVQHVDATTSKPKVFVPAPTPSAPLPPEEIERISKKASGTS